MYTPVEIHFSEACWRFLHSDVMKSMLTAELRAILDLSPRVRVVPTDPAPRYVVTMLRLHAHELLTLVGVALNTLAQGAPGREECAQCLDDLEQGIKPQPRPL